MLEALVLDKTPFDTAEGITSWDLNNISKDALKGLAWLSAALLGDTSTVVNGLLATQTTSPSMSIQIAEGQIYKFTDTDAAPIGTLEADDTQILQQGHADARTIALNSSGLTAGQSKWWLIEAEFEQVAGIRPGDPTEGNRGFYNSSNPASPLNGPDGLGAAINTIIAGVCHVSAIDGAAATSGSAVPPSPSSGCVPLFLIEVVYGQTTIGNGDIQIAGNAAYAGYQEAPFLAGILRSHHNGKPGQAPKILLDSEVSGTLPLANLPASNTIGILSTLRHGVVNPQGVVAGNVDDAYLNTVLSALFYCTTTGDAAGAVWIQVGLGDIALAVDSFPIDPVLAAVMYLCDTTSTPGTATLEEAATYFGAPVRLKNIGTDVMTITPATGESIEGKPAAPASGCEYILNPGDAIKLYPGTGTWYEGV